MTQIFEEPEYRLIGKEMLVGDEFEGGWIKTLIGAVVGGAASGVAGSIATAIIADAIPGPAVPG